MSKTDFKLIAAIRKTTGAALHRCKQALHEAKGNFENAIELIKKMGHALSEQKADQPTSEGCIVGHVYQTTEGSYRGGLLECQSETDFVSNNESFISFSKEVLEIALKNNVRNLEEVLNLPFNQAQTVDQARQLLVGKVGENVQISHYEMTETNNQIGLYVHKGRYASLVVLKGPNPAIAKDIAIHIVVSYPSGLSELMKQDFYKDPSKTIEQYLTEHASQIVKYTYIVLGSENNQS